MRESGRLGHFEEVILLALVRLGDTAYGITIRREIAERTGRNVALGAVYTTLDRLIVKGYVSDRLGEPTAQRGGRAKRYFKIEDPGLNALNHAQEVVAQMREGLARSSDLGR